MIQTVDAIWEDGRLRPLEPLALGESQRVRVTIASGGGSQRDDRMVEWARAQIAGKEIPSVEEVRAIVGLSPGSLAADVSAERGEY